MEINFAEETVNALNRYHYSINDISWIGNRRYDIPIHEFFDAARKTNYNNGYGLAAMPLDLLIVLKDGSYFERAEYDGSEWWRYVAAIDRPSYHTHLKYKSFADGSYDRYDPYFDDCVIGKE